ncbi:hypothetical protein CEXT_89061 [Caerostris extrusa]|uniref:Uncharacterized protein n=1 Tax=Caerostris extrusa TaxID=172846 RepID=A0AAV4T013_CAEEX|nr:hypothetical protein CEXT_89061 [Caerostris extrusa]
MRPNAKTTKRDSIGMQIDLHSPRRGECGLVFRFGDRRTDFYKIGGLYIRMFTMVSIRSVDEPHMHLNIPFQHSVAAEIECATNESDEKSSVNQSIFLHR